MISYCFLEICSFSLSLQIYGHKVIHCIFLLVYLLFSFLVSCPYRMNHLWTRDNFFRKFLITQYVIRSGLVFRRASLVAQLVKNLPVMWETWVRSLVWEDPQGEGTATRSSILAWRITLDRGAWGLQSTGSLLPVTL